MGGERFEAIVFAFQSFFVKQSVEVVMAGSGEPGNAVLYFFAFEFAFVPFVGVAGPRNEMVAGEHRDAATTELAGLIVSHREILARQAICRS